MNRTIGQIDMMTMESLLYGSGGSPHTGLYGDNTNAGRGVSAIQRRAQQLKRWQENEDQMGKAERECGHLVKKRSGPRIKFSNATLFLAACATNDYDECEKLIDSGLVDINVTNIDGLTALHQACIDDNLEMVNFLISKGADFNACDNEGWTPLHATASCGHVTIAEALLEAGSDPRVINNDGELASDLADSEAIRDVIESQLKKMDIDNIDELRKQEMLVMTQDVNEWLQSGVYDDKPHKRTGATILHVAAAKGYISVLSSLLNNKMIRAQLDVNIKDSEGWTPLAAACYWQQPGAVELLLLSGADVDVKTSTGQSLDELTDHELIHSQLENRRKKLKEEQKLKEQQEKEKREQLLVANESQQKVNILAQVAQSPPSLTGPTESETQRKAHAKRARETRRSTQGVSADDVTKAKEQLKQQAVVTTAVANNEEESAGKGTSTPVISYVINNRSERERLQEDKDDVTKAKEQVKCPQQQVQTPSAVELDGHGPSSCKIPSSSVVSNGSEQRMRHQEKEDELDYKRLYEELLVEVDKLKKESHLKEQEWNRTKRQQLRKFSEYEEEVKLLAQFETDNQRLKDENGALIRVISKLSK